MSSLFSSPSKSASQAASAEEGLSQQQIQQAEDYVNTSEQNLRSNLPTGAQNPYLNAGAKMTPAASVVNPQNTQQVGPSGTASPTAAPPPQAAGTNYFAAPQTTNQFASMPPPQQNPYLAQVPPQRTS